MRNRLKVVIDTNVFLRIVPPKSEYHYVFRAFLDDKFDWFVSTEILLEYEEILAQFYGKEVIDALLKGVELCPNVYFTTPHFALNLIVVDSDDNKFVDVAFAQNTDFIVTNDKHFKVLASVDFPQISVCSLEDFGEILKTI